ncbi:hypothetical protein [Lysinibacter cavernae]|uniref:Uncharacterized protein n=1 Tax=Lysinibacter cavernae TaxID=1640652 RepID=A0A7X5R4Q2_9MICO|nr:hypothetical protein [Lysinibacter cavernae]NIH55337.1 hypothetical protein [Lysinibacter cavernae]
MSTLPKHNAPSASTPASVAFGAAAWYFVFATIVVVMAFTFGEAGTIGTITFIVMILLSAAAAVGCFWQAKALKQKALLRDWPERKPTVIRKIIGAILIAASVVGGVASAPYLFVVLILSTSATGGDGGGLGITVYVLVSLAVLAVLCVGAMLYRAGSAYPGHPAQKPIGTKP